MLQSGQKAIPQGIRVLVCGGRKWWEWAKSYRALDELHANQPIGIIIAGGANGADAMAARWAEDRGIQLIVCPAPWNGPHGRGAGPVRNAFMLCLEPDLVIAFPGGPGTAGMVRIAREQGVFVIEIEGAKQKDGE